LAGGRDLGFSGRQLGGAFLLRFHHLDQVPRRMASLNFLPTTMMNRSRNPNSMSMLDNIQHTLANPTHHPGLATPLEASSILWQRCPVRACLPIIKAKGRHERSPLKSSAMMIVRTTTQSNTQHNENTK
jgi:hypothetical protein